MYCRVRNVQSVQLILTSIIPEKSPIVLILLTQFEPSQQRSHVASEYYGMKERDLTPKKVILLQCAGQHETFAGPHRQVPLLNSNIRGYVFGISLALAMSNLAGTKN